MSKQISKRRISYYQRFYTFMAFMSLCLMAYYLMNDKISLCIIWMGGFLSSIRQIYFPTPFKNKLFFIKKEKDENYDKDNIGHCFLVVAGDYIAILCIFYGVIRGVGG